MNEEKSWLDKYAPVGVNLAQEVLGYVMAATFSVAYSSLFLGRYMEARDEMYEWVNGKKVLIDGAMMPRFETLIDGCFIVFVIALIGMASVTIYHYLYHYQGTKSIYVMRRLENKWELHRRCITLPIAAMLITAMIAVVLYFVYQGIYLMLTPQQCLPF